MSSTAWKLKHVSDHFLQQVRGAIPYGADQTKMMLQVIQHFHPSPVLQVMDLGSGNGILAKLLLQCHPDARAVLIDHSAPMLAKAAEYMESYLDRCTLIEADLDRPILEVTSQDSLDCIVSGYAIHHLTHTRKQTLYAEIFRALKPGGVFINIEHTASATPELESLHDELFIEHLAACNNRSRDEVAKEYYGRPDKADNILANVFTQIGWLKDIGFQHADCYMKWMELAVFGGIKEKKQE